LLLTHALRSLPPKKEEKGAKILSSTDDHRHYHLRSFITASTSHGQRDCGQFEKEIYIRCHRFAWQQDFNQHMHTQSAEMECYEIFQLGKVVAPSDQSYVWLRGYVHYLRVRNLKTSKVVKVNNLWKSQQMEQGIGPPCDDWMTLFRMEITITKKIISSHKISYRGDEIALPYSVLMFYI